MSLTSAMYTGVSGLLANASAINVIGNNLSNVNTVGFKDGRTLFSTMLSSSIGNNSQIGNGVQIQAVQNLFGAGSYESSTNVTDLAIQGSGFFALAAPSATTATTVTPGAAYYTRAGAFGVDSNNYLVNPDGYKVLDTAGNPIQLPQTVTGPPALTYQKVSGVDSNGNIALLYADASGNTSTLYYAGVGAVPVATTATAVKIAEVIVPNPQGMQAQSGTLFTLTTASGTPAALTSANGTSEKMLSNELEGSNVDMATELVNMITTQRAYSANSKTITTADQMTQEVLSLKQ
jgi:flagellar hook protein FlgE